MALPGRATALLPVLMAALLWHRPLAAADPGQSYHMVQRGPAFVKFEGPLYMNGPAWRIGLATLRWSPKP